MDGKKLPKDLTGLRFGCLTVIARDGYFRNGRLYTWQCLCDCGKSASILGTHLRRGITTSCGCGRHKTQAKIKHGKAKKAIYALWCSMRERCTNQNCQSYQRYGGRGIKVCERWQDFANFYEDMGDCPAPGLTLERVNNDGNYEPSNVRWATRKEQANNTRRNRVFKTSRGQMTMAQLAECVGISTTALRKRIKRGATGDQLLLPKNPRTRRVFMIS